MDSAERLGSAAPVLIVLETIAPPRYRPTSYHAPMTLPFNMFKAANRVVVQRRLLQRCRLHRQFRSIRRWLRNTSLRSHPP